MKSIILFYVLGIIFCIPALLSAFFEFPYRGFWDTNETYFVMLALISPLFFLSGFYFLKLKYHENLFLYFGMFSSIYLSIPDINLQYLDDIRFESREASYSFGAIAFFILETILLVYLVRREKERQQQDYQKEKQLQFSAL